MLEFWPTLGLFLLVIGCAMWCVEYGYRRGRRDGLRQAADAIRDPMLDFADEMMADYLDHTADKI